jgi:hypothetical protein
MLFSAWINNSKVVDEFDEKVTCHISEFTLIMIRRVVEAAYKAGRRQGVKDAQEHEQNSW